jgi:hypothetical protein
LKPTLRPGRTTAGFSPLSARAERLLTTAHASPSAEFRLAAVTGLCNLRFDDINTETEDRNTASINKTSMAGIRLAGPRNYASDYYE